MCRFCTEHGEGKKWYLEIKNYADQLLYEELSSDQKEIVGVSTRVEYLNDLFENFIMPAMSGVSEKPDEPESEPPSSELRIAHLGTQNESLAWQADLQHGDSLSPHFEDAGEGQICPGEHHKQTREEDQRRQQRMHGFFDVKEYIEDGEEYQNRQRTEDEPPGRQRDRLQVTHLQCHMARKQRGEASLQLATRCMAPRAGYH